MIKKLTIFVCVLSHVYGTASQLSSTCQRATRESFFTTSPVQICSNKQLHKDKKTFFDQQADFNCPEPLFEEPNPGAYGSNPLVLLCHASVESFFDDSVP